MKAAKIYDQKLLWYVYTFLDYDKVWKSKESFTKDLLKNIHETNVWYAGFAKKQYLKCFLEDYIFFNHDHKSYPKLELSKIELLDICAYSIKKCQKELPSYPVRIYIFPSFNEFHLNKMDGVAWFSAWKNSIILFVHPEKKNPKNAIINTICHEYNHAVAQNYHSFGKILNNIIFEWYAENFREYLAWWEQAPWTIAVSKSECKKYIKELKPKLNSKSYKLSQDIMFGTWKYPLWLGYSLGYHIVKEFIQKYPNRPWWEIVKIKPQEILKLSEFDN